ncbi:MAG: hypothetical protein AB1609_11135 [Bacillota bacterium]
MRQLWWSLLALVASVALGIWMLSFAGVIDIGGAVSTRLRRMPVVADYITAYQRGTQLEQSQAEMEAQLERQRQELDKREQALQQRSQELARLEKQLQAREQDLARRLAEVAKREQELAGAADREKYYRELIEAVAQMRPEQAAPIIEQLDMELARRLLGSMEPRQAGAILGRLDPKYASKLLAAINELPLNDSQKLEASSGGATTSTAQAAPSGGQASSGR